MSIYDKRFFVKILKSFYQDKNNGPEKELDHISPETLNEESTERVWQQWSGNQPSALVPRDRTAGSGYNIANWTQAARIWSVRCKNTWENVDSNSRPKISCNLFQMFSTHYNLKY